MSRQKYNFKHPHTITGPSDPFSSEESELKAQRQKIKITPDKMVSVSLQSVFFQQTNKHVHYQNIYRWKMSYFPSNYQRKWPLVSDGLV